MEKKKLYYMLGRNQRSNIGKSEYVKNLNIFGIKKIKTIKKKKIRKETIDKGCKSLPSRTERKKS